MDPERQVFLLVVIPPFMVYGRSRFCCLHVMDAAVIFSYTIAKSRAMFELI
jgi:hypothetical protein